MKRSSTLSSLPPDFYIIWKRTCFLSTLTLQKTQTEIFCTHTAQPRTSHTLSDWMTNSSCSLPSHRSWLSQKREIQMMTYLSDPPLLNLLPGQPLLYGASFNWWLELLYIVLTQGLQFSMDLSPFLSFILSYLSDFEL